jgi:hypothetical protein
MYLLRLDKIVYYKYDLKVCDDGILTQLLCFWTLSIVLFLFKTHDVSETGFCLRFQVGPTQLGPIDRVNPYLQNHNNCIIFYN